MDSKIQINDLRQAELSNIFCVNRLDFDPCIKLWKAVLCQAIYDLAEGLSADYLDAQRWIGNTRNRKINSFVGVCEVIGIDCEYARNILLNNTFRWIWTINGEDFETLKEAAKKFHVSKHTVRGWCLGSEAGKYYYPPRSGCRREIRIYGRKRP